MNQKNQIEQFWQNYLDTLSEPGRNVSYLDAWGFGDSPKMADELGHLVKSGTKTATCSMLWEYEQGNEVMSKEGDIHIILDGNGSPLCIIRIIEVTVKPYNEVDAQFAYEEGEGDRSLAYWREVHWTFFSRNCSSADTEVREDMPLVCERFRVLFP